VSDSAPPPPPPFLTASSMAAKEASIAPQCAPSGAHAIPCHKQPAPLPLADLGATLSHIGSTPQVCQTSYAPQATPALAESSTTVSLDLSTGLVADPLGTAWRISPWPGLGAAWARPDALADSFSPPEYSGSEAQNPAVAPSRSQTLTPADVCQQSKRGEALAGNRAPPAQGQYSAAMHGPFTAVSQALGSSVAIDHPITALTHKQRLSSTVPETFTAMPPDSESTISLGPSPTSLHQMHPFPQLPTTAPADSESSLSLELSSAHRP
jgi:hypothetical protein